MIGQDLDPFSDEFCEAYCFVRTGFDALQTRLSVTKIFSMGKKFNLSNAQDRIGPSRNYMAFHLDTFP
jgi:hypothetical protein